MPPSRGAGHTVTPNPIRPAIKPLIASLVARASLTETTLQQPASMNPSSVDVIRRRREDEPNDPSRNSRLCLLTALPYLGGATSFRSGSEVPVPWTVEAPPEAELRALQSHTKKVPAAQKRRSA